MKCLRRIPISRYAVAVTLLSAFPSAATSGEIVRPSAVYEGAIQLEFGDDFEESDGYPRIEVLKNAAEFEAFRVRLTEKMPEEKAHSILGSPSSASEKSAIWKTGGRIGEGARVLSAVVHPDGSYGGWRVAVLKK